mmetsp:Transcript_22100/g.64127  ORF Transcript_22100/g.64127 Transcript_22100/m.64127 type:complete len:206 (+) Transcript_22100:109-726(+)
MRNVDHPPRGGPSVGVLVLAWNGGACGVRRPPFVSLTPLSTSSLSLGTRRTTARPPSIIKPPLLSCCLATPDRPALCCVCGCVVFYARARQPRIFFEIPLKRGRPAASSPRKPSLSTCLLHRRRSERQRHPQLCASNAGLRRKGLQSRRRHHIHRQRVSGGRQLVRASCPAPSLKNPQEAPPAADTWSSPFGNQHSTESHRRGST